MVECSECKKFYDCLYGGELVGRLTSCPDFQQKPKTNADRIRAMSDDLLATQLVQVVKETIKALTELDLPDEITNEIRSNLLEKLKQPAEG